MVTAREKCMMLIKQEPVSPGVRGVGSGGTVVARGDAVLVNSSPSSPSCEVCSSEPPVLPVAMVQSVLEGRGSVGAVIEKRSKRLALDRVDLSDAVENVDMSLEELQHLLLRSHQQNTVESGSSTVMDPFSLSLPLNEWNFTDVECNLKSYIFQNEESEDFPTSGCEEQ